MVSADRVTCLVFTAVATAAAAAPNHMQTTAGGVAAASAFVPTGNIYSNMVSDRQALSASRSRQSWRGHKTQRRSAVQGLTCRVTPPPAYSNSDWWNNVLNLPKSRLLEKTSNHLVFNTLWAVVISLIHEYTPQHLIDLSHVTTVPHSLMASALGLLLVFRSNAAYDRFWEARKVWGSVTNTVRNTARLAGVNFKDDPLEYRTFLEYLKAFPMLLKQHLRDERVDEDLAWMYLPQKDFEAMQEDPNPPLFVCQRMTEVMSRTFATKPPDDLTAIWYRQQLEDQLGKLIDFLGMCERILTTPVPRSYSRHTSRFLTFYCAALPIVLVPTTGLFTAPVVGAMCWGLFSIEEIAYYIEQPFDKDRKQLDLHAYAEKMRRDMERMANQNGLPAAGSGMNGSKPGEELAIMINDGPEQEVELANPFSWTSSSGPE